MGRRGGGGRGRKRGRKRGELTMTWNPEIIRSKRGNVMISELKRGESAKRNHSIF